MDETVKTTDADGSTVVVCQMCDKPFQPRVLNQRPFCGAECEGLWMSELRRNQPRPGRMSRGGY